LGQDGFYDLVKEVWSSVTTGDSPIDIWQNKICYLCQYFQGWARNMSGVYKKEKEKLIKIIDHLDIKAE
jgi:hypothetical protein